jgi:glycosyltransferase involved in cell wall biosynthesis
MAAAGALALPSLWEGSSNVLLEAMACGTPVIASRTAGDAEHVLDGGKHGVLVDPHDVESLAAALVRQTGTGRVEPGNRVQSFARDHAMSRYIQLFDQLASQASQAKLMTRSISQ